jgi:peptidase M15-like protein
MKDKRLSENFLLSEMLRSETATMYNIYEQFHPPIEIVDNLQCLCVDFLQPLRKKFTFAINITSGYRCIDLNNHPTVQGSKRSHHLRGMAVDVTSVNNAVLFDLVVNNFKFTQAIWYYSDEAQPDFLHLSYDPHDLKCQILTCKLVANSKGVMRRTYENISKDYARQKNG